jgi:hypothetical protein
MAKKIGVEPDLTPVKDYLTEKGYDVVSINDSTSDITSNKYDAIVVTGLNKDFMGIEDTSFKGKVINASGLTPPEVEDQIKNLNT